MMTINDIKRLIANDEHRTLEVKKSTGELKDGMHAACAMLNTEGGWLIFGVTPQSLKILGQEVTDATQREIAQALAGLEPAVDVRVEYVDVPERPGNKVIAMCFDPFVWGREPYTFHGCPYYKVESTTKQMPREMFEERLKAAKPQYYAWERQKAEGVGLEDIDEGRVRGALRLGVERGRLTPSALTESFETLLAKLKLLTNDGLPNNAAAFLFGTKLNRYTQFQLRMARFIGNKALAFHDNLVAEGNFFDLLDAGTSFFFKHLNQSGKVVGFVREEHLEIPAEALREALVNALCHRKWEQYNLTISIAIFDDRVEISNPGAFPPQLSIETLKQHHDSFPYNPIIAEVLFKSTYLEKWGTGVRRIIDVCQEEGVEEPVWSQEMGHVKVTFKRPTDRVTNYATNHAEHPSNLPENQQDDRSSGQVTNQATNYVTNYAGDRVNDRVTTEYNDVRQSNPYYIAIIDYCVIPRSRREILEHLNLTVQTFNFNRYIKPLLDSGNLGMTKPEVPKSPNQKYVTIKK